jgi:hypothetical protein
MIRSVLFIRLFILFALALVIAGCVLPSQQFHSNSENSDLFLPPTLVPTIKATSQGTAKPKKSDSPANCTDQLKFISDLTIPDGTIVQPGATIDKRWSIENSGTCNWDSKYTLRLIAGPDMGASPEQPLYPSRSGSRAEIRITFNAPTKPAAYRSAWQAYNPDGNPFGDPFYIDILVVK